MIKDVTSGTCIMQGWYEVILRRKQPLFVQEFLSEMIAFTELGKGPSRKIDVPQNADNTSNGNESGPSTLPSKLCKTISQPPLNPTSGIKQTSSLKEIKDETRKKQRHSTVVGAISSTDESAIEITPDGRKQPLYVQKFLSEMNAITQFRRAKSTDKYT